MPANPGGDPMLDLALGESGHHVPIRAILLKEALDPLVARAITMAALLGNESSFDSLLAGAWVQ